ncbi:MAG: pyruvate kinase, partial [Propionibacteriales bacterium]|nr:pyruvate kinase [Propionibacteriales bacterium]
MRRAKIVCTLGPATDTLERIQHLAESGMDVARLNMSHGTREEHEAVYGHVRTATDTIGKAIAVIADLQGPKIRLGTFADGPVMLELGATFAITTDDVPGTAERCSTTYKGIVGDVAPGDEILIDDGRIRLRALEVTDTDVVTRVEIAGVASDHKGINLPGVQVNVPTMSEKDIDDLRWA